MPLATYPRTLRTRDGAPGALRVTAANRLNETVMASGRHPATLHFADSIKASGHPQSGHRRPANHPSSGRRPTHPVRPHLSGHKQPFNACCTPAWPTRFRWPRRTSRSRCAGSPSLLKPPATSLSATAPLGYMSTTPPGRVEGEAGSAWSFLAHSVLREV